MNFNFIKSYAKINLLLGVVGKIKIIDVKKNEYFLKELHVDTEKKEMIGSDISVILDQKNFGVSEENDPRFVRRKMIPIFGPKMTAFSVQNGSIYETIFGPKMEAFSVQKWKHFRSENGGIFVP